MRIKDENILTSSDVKTNRWTSYVENNEMFLLAADVDRDGETTFD